MSEHTKGRWYRFIKPNGRASVRLEETGETLASDLSPADAERIVLMHASHEALVEALEALLRDCDNTKGIIHPKGHPGYLQARAALALARGE